MGTRTGNLLDMSRTSATRLFHIWKLYRIFGPYLMQPKKGVWWSFWPKYGHSELEETKWTLNFQFLDSNSVSECWPLIKWSIRLSKLLGSAFPLVPTMLLCTWRIKMGDHISSIIDLADLLLSDTASLFCSLFVLSPPSLPEPSCFLCPLPLCGNRLLL